MKSLVFSGIAVATALATAPIANASDSLGLSPQNINARLISVAAQGASPGHGQMPHPSMGGMHMPRPGMGGMHMPKPNMGGQHRWGSRVGGRWIGGHNAPGGWNGYRAAFRGYMMPRYWVNPSFLIGNYSLYNLRAPSAGYSWYRYYDDAVLSDNRGYVYDSVQNLPWDQYEGGYAPQSDDSGFDTPEYGPSIRADSSAYDWNDNGNVAFAAPDGSRYSYDGDWRGQYVDNEGRVFEGQWDGTVTRQGGNDGGARYGAPPVAQPPIATRPYPSGPEYSVPRGYEGYEKCLRNNGLSGGAIGAILGGVVGNRVAGRGNRTIGTILGAGAGGIAGAVIEKSMNSCDKYQPRYDRAPATRPYPYPQGQYPQNGYPQGGYSHSNYQQSWGGGYYYPAPIITTVTVTPATTVTTVTEEISYETVYARPSRKVVRKYRPRPKPQCGCR